MSQQPEALRLADAISKAIRPEASLPVGDWVRAAAELRRLHDENQQWKEKCDAYIGIHDAVVKDNERLHEVNAELLAALDYVIRDLELRSNLKRGDEWGEIDIGHGAYMQAKAAITKATGGVA